MDLEERVQALEDHKEIVELRYKYGHYIDNRDWENYFDLFTDDIHCDYGWHGQFNGIDELRQVADKFGDKYEYTAHLYFQPLISIDGDSATGVWYSIIFHGFKDDDVGGWRQARYDETYRRVDGEWKFAEVSHTFFSRNLFRYIRRDSVKDGNVVEYLGPIVPE